jgi:hypothetical protein
MMSPDAGLEIFLPAIGKEKGPLVKRPFKMQGKV